MSTGIVRCSRLFVSGAACQDPAKSRFQFGPEVTGRDPWTGGLVHLGRFINELKLAKLFWRRTSPGGDMKTPVLFCI